MSGWSRTRSRSVDQGRDGRRAEARIAALGLAEHRRRENIDKALFRARQRFRAGRAVRCIVLDGLEHEAGCECYDCLYGSGKAMWDEALRLERLTAFQVHDDLDARKAVLGRIYGEGK